MIHALRVALFCLVGCSWAALATADDAKPRIEVIEAGETAVVVIEPAHRPAAELVPLLAALTTRPTVDGQRLVCQVTKANLAAVRALVERLDRPAAEVVVLARVEEVLEPIGGRLGKTQVIERRLLRLRATVGQPTELVLEQRPGGKAQEVEDRQKLKVTPDKIDARGARVRVDFELDLPGPAGPGEEEGGGRSRLRREGTVRVRLPATRALTVVEVELGQERGGRRVFRIWMRALVGEAASASPDWERRIEVRRIVLDTPPYAVLRLDGVEYQVRKGARLGELQVVDIAEDVTFRVGKSQFSLSAK